MNNPQSAIIQSVPLLARYLSFSIADKNHVLPVMQEINDFYKDGEMVIGLGPVLMDTVGNPIKGLTAFPDFAANGLNIPSTSCDLWCWLKGEDRGVLLHQTRQIEKILAPGFQLKKAIDSFRYLDGHDLSGYEDGTENPEGDEALAAAIVSDDAQLNGSSFLAVQQWVHDLNTFEAMKQSDRDNIIGRRLSDNEELEDAPASAHVKRTAQEDFEPEAFILRRSMPWSDETRAGLVFVAFGHSFYAFDAQMKRMIGADDGIVDGLFQFSRPITGSYLWCPSVSEGSLDLSMLGI
jgi:putative iron-dependent peroxidase